MIQYRKPVRNNVPQALTYTFKDQDDVVIDLTTFNTPTLEVKRQGVVFATVSATVSSPPQGLVTTTYTFTGVGTWDVQFYLSNGLGQRLYGEPLQLVVVPNVDDLALSQLAKY